MSESPIKSKSVEQVSKTAESKKGADTPSASTSFETEKVTQERIAKNSAPGEAYSSQVNARFWLRGESSYVGIGRITLLEKIESLGSMNAAAKDMKMSYKKAWQLIDEMNQMFSEPLVIKAQGGKSGGGTQLTDKGHQVIREFRRIEQELQTFLQTVSDRLDL